MIPSIGTDVETRSAVDLRKVGAFRYFEDPTTDVLCCSTELPNGEMVNWTRSQPCPPAVAEHIKSGGLIYAWNATFEWLAFKHVLGPRYSWPVPEIEQMRDTMAYAAALSLPQALDRAAGALGLPVEKDKDGKRLIQKFSKPRRKRKGDTPGKLYWNEPEDHPEDFHKFSMVYCPQDVVVEREARKRLVPLSDQEQEVWELNLRMNDRGIRIDRPLVEAMLKITDDAKADLDQRMATATSWEITACSQVSALTNWCKLRGVEVESLDKNGIQALLGDYLPPDVREALLLRQEAAKTSTAKLATMSIAAGSGDRVRGCHQYHGAGTGRWAGRLVQTQNMTRGSGTVKNPERAKPHFLAGNADFIRMLYNSPMSACSDMLRSCLIASEGHRLLVADYSSIEGRGTAWVADEIDEIAAYEANDAGTGAGIYEIAAGGIFNEDPFHVTKDQRQVGKAASLALGFGGGVVAFHSMAKIYGIDMAPVFPILKSTADPETFERACDSYKQASVRGDMGTDLMTREAWIASEVTKILWREKHPKTVALWDGLERAARSAVEALGTIQTYGRISYLVRNGFLWCRLPSGRCLAYGAPKIQERKTPWGAMKPAVTGMNVDSATKQWKRSALYGGLLCENVVQAVARDLMANGLLKAEAAGYPIVLTVHDEGVADVPNGFGSLAEFEDLLCDLPTWAEGIPLVAAGYEAQSYRKD